MLGEDVGGRLGPPEGRKVLAAGRRGFPHGEFFSPWMEPVLKGRFDRVFDHWSPSAREPCSDP